MARFQTSYEFNTLAEFKSAIVNSSHELYKHLALTEVDYQYPENFTGNSAICYVKELNTTINCGTNVISDIKTGRPGDMVIYDTELKQFFCIFDRFYEDESYTYKTSNPTVKIYKIMTSRLNRKYVNCGRILKVKGNKITIFKTFHRGGNFKDYLKISKPINVSFCKQLNIKTIQGYNTYKLTSGSLYPSFKSYLIKSDSNKLTEEQFNTALRNTIDNKGVFKLTCSVYVGNSSATSKTINLDTNYTFNQNYKSFITHYLTPKYPDNVGLFSKNYVNGKGMTKKLLDEILFKETTIYKDSAGTIIPATDVTQVDGKYYKTTDITNGTVNEGATQLSVLTETVKDTSDTLNVLIKTYTQTIDSVPGLTTGNWYIGSVYEYLDFPDLNAKYNFFTYASSNYINYILTSNYGKNSSNNLEYVVICRSSSSSPYFYITNYSTSNSNSDLNCDDDYNLIPLADIYV
jgi:hypothetical protein